MAPVIIRQVWAANLKLEFLYIRDAILSGFRFAAVDTEFPGTIYDPLPQKAYSLLPPQEYYSILKRNVDELHIIQLGLTLFDANGNLPNLNTAYHYVWQFNFSDFDKNIHPHNKDSISFLEDQGIDFSINKKFGINSINFAAELGLILPFKLTWITFHGSYDFALLIKTMSRQKLTNSVSNFMTLVNLYFGGLSFDVKLISSFMGMTGGLEKVGKSLGLARVFGKCHQAGSDSLLTMQVFMELCKRNSGVRKFNRLNDKLYGLTSPE